MHMVAAIGCHFATHEGLDPSRGTSLLPPSLRPWSLAAAGCASFGLRLPGEGSGRLPLP